MSSTYVPPAAAFRAASPVPSGQPPYPDLTLRQRECLYWASQGKSAPDIGAIMGLSGRTVEGHLARTCEQLGVRTRIQAVLRARDLGVLQPDRP